MIDLPPMQILDVSIIFTLIHFLVFVKRMFQKKGVLFVIYIS